MKSTGIVRKVDELGRVVLPVELRRMLGISIKDSLEIYIDDGAIVLKKHASSCVFCGNTADISEFKNKSVCAECLKELSK